MWLPCGLSQQHDIVLPCTIVCLCIHYSQKPRLEFLFKLLQHPGCPHYNAATDRVAEAAGLEPMCVYAFFCEDKEERELFHAIHALSVG
jgi:hypothetical protein